MTKYTTTSKITKNDKNFLIIPPAFIRLHYLILSSKLIIISMSKIISFASDFGLNDGSVGVVKGVISRIDDSLKVNDISHGIPPQDIKYGSLLLMRAIQYIPQGVLLAVVDPGVGTDRNAIAITTDWGVMIGPDNGLLNLACQQLEEHKKLML